MSYNKRQLSKDKKKLNKPTRSKKLKNVVEDPRGQLAHPGKVTRIPSGDITMQGVPYPVLGIDDMGYEQMMYPDQNYQFPGSSVTEYPQLFNGGQPPVIDRLGRVHPGNSGYIPWAQDGGPTPAKAREILHDGTVHGKPLTDKQRKYFGYISNLKTGGMTKAANPFWYIQNERQFFSPGYPNIPGPYQGSSFAYGGGFGEGHPFSTQPTLAEISDYGRPTYGAQYIAELGGTGPDIYDSFPIARMGGKGCYKCGGAHKMKHGGGKKYSHILGLNPADPKTRDQLVPEFAQYLQSAAINANLENMNKMALEAGLANGGTGYTEQFPLATPYQYGYPDNFEAVRPDIDNLKAGGTKNWLKDIKSTGQCTGKNYGGPRCRPGTRQYAFAKRARSGEFSKKAYGGEEDYNFGGGKLDPWVEQGYTPTDPTAAVPSSYYYPGQSADTPNVQTFNPRDISTQAVPNVATAAAPRAQIYDPRVQQKIADRRGFGSFADYVASGQDPTLAAKFPQYAAEPIAQITQKYGGSKPKAQGGFQFTPDYRKTQRMAALKTALKNKGINYDNMSDEQIIQLGINNKMISRGTAGSQAGYDPYGYNPYGNYMQGANPYGGGWPGGAYKVKNRFNFYGAPGLGFPQASTTQGMTGTPGTISPEQAAALKAAGMWYDQDVKHDIWSRIGLARGPKRVRTRFGFGEQPPALPSGKQSFKEKTGRSRIGTLLGKGKESLDKYGVLFPSKRQKEEYASEQERMAAQQSEAAALAAYQENALNQPPIPGTASIFPGGYPQAPMTGAPVPTFNRDTYQVQDPALMPWLNEQSQKLGVPVEDLINPPGASPAALPAPAAAAAAAPAETPYEFPSDYKPSRRIRRAERRNPGSTFLSLPEYEQYKQEGGQGYVDLNSLKPDLNLDPTTDPDRLDIPGLASSTLSNEERVRAIGDNPEDQVGPGGFGFEQDAKRERAGVADFYARNAQLQGVTALANIPHQNRLEDFNAERMAIANRVSSQHTRDRGDYTPNYGYFRPDQQNVGRMITGRFGGALQEGGVYEGLSEEDLQMLRAGGYEFDIID